MTGVSFSHLIEILKLTYADDIVFLSKSYIGMKRILMFFYEYCLKNKLVVNFNKTKIILFQKGGHGHNKRQAPFLYKQEKLEYVNEYVYLGIKYTQTAFFKQATKEAVSKAKATASETLQLIFSQNINSIEVSVSLFDSFCACFPCI